MKQGILIMLMILGLSQCVYYNIKEDKQEVIKDDFEEKKEIKYKDIITNFNKFNNIEVDKIIKSEKSHIIDINFKGNLSQLKEIIDYTNSEYECCEYTYRSIKMEDELINGEITVGIS